MKNPNPQSPAPGVTVEEVSSNAPQVPFFTPPTPPNAQPAKEEPVIGDGKEFEVTKTEELPAKPHEHGESDPHSVGDSPGTEVIS